MVWQARGEVRGPVGTFDAVTAVDLPAGSEATAVIGGTPEHRTVTFGIPEGRQGLPGVNGVENDTAVATYMGDPDSETGKQLATTIEETAVGRVQTAVIPAGLGLDSRIPELALSFTENVRGDRVGSIGHTPEQFFDHFSTARATPVVTYWVDINVGNDANAGTTSGTPVQSIWRAVELANLNAPAPAAIRVIGGNTRLYRYGYGFCKTDNTLIAPGTDIAFLAQGTVRIAAWQEAVTDIAFTADGTHPQLSVYLSYSSPGGHGPVDPSRPDENGDPTAYRQVATKLACAQSPGTYFHDVPNTDLYVHSFDGGPVTATNTAVFRGNRRNFHTANEGYNVFFGAVVPGAGRWRFYGGSEGPVSIKPGTLESGNVDLFGAVVFSEARFMFAPENYNGVNFTRWPGVLALFACGADRNSADGFNAHNDGTPSATSITLITVNCEAFHNGTTGVSRNALTLHETCKGIDVASRFGDSAGVTVRNIGTSKQLLFGTIAEGDRGDVHNGGQFYPTGVGAGGSAEIWADRVSVRMAPGATPFRAEDAGSKVHLHMVDATPGTNWATGTIDNY